MMVQVGPKSNDEQPYDNRYTETHREGLIKTDGKINVSTSPRMPTATRNWTRQGVQSPLEPLDVIQQCPHVDFWT